MKRYFSFPLFIDGFRQLKLFGIFSTVIIGLASVFVPLSTMLDERDSTYLPTISGADINVLLLLCTFVMAPVFVLYLFSFLNKRNTSDFYHSIPVSRTCIYISYMASVIAWITVIIVINFVLSYVLFFTLTSSTMYHRTIITYVLNVWIGSLYSAVTVSLAMCISGTALTNIVVSGIILFFPRLYILVLSYCICDMPFMSYEHFIPILTPSYNIVFGSIASIFEFGTGNPFYMLSSSIYTFCLAIVYFFLAVYLFSKRKSESAGCAAPSKRLQNVYRILIGFIICLIPIGLISSMIITHSYDFNSEDILMLVFCYVIAVLVYFAYEVITTKKLRNVPKTLPGLGILVLLNIFSLCFIRGGVTIAKSFTPTADEIDYIYILDESFVDFYGYGETEYYSYIQSKVKIEEPEVKEVFAKMLKELSSASQYNTYNTTTYTIKIKAGSKTCYRKIPLTSTESALLQKCLEANEEYHDKFVNLPNYNSLGTTCRVEEESGKYLSASQRKTLYESVQKEIQDLGYEKWYERYHTENFESLYSPWFYISTYVDTTSCYLSFPLTILPDSFLLYAKMVTTDDNITNANRFLENPRFSSQNYFRCSIDIIDLQALSVCSTVLYYDEDMEIDEEYDENSYNNYQDYQEASEKKEKTEEKEAPFTAEENLLTDIKKFILDSNYEDYTNSRYIVILDVSMIDHNKNYYTDSFFIPIKGNADFEAVKKAIHTYNNESGQLSYYE